jgi:hypothetical protein
MPQIQFGIKAQIAGGKKRDRWSGPGKRNTPWGRIPFGGDAGRANPVTIPCLQGRVGHNSIGHVNRAADLRGKCDRTEGNRGAQ